MGSEYVNNFLSSAPQCSENGDQLLEEGNAKFTGKFLYVRIYTINLMSRLNNMKVR